MNHASASCPASGLAQHPLQGLAQPPWVGACPVPDQCSHLSLASAETPCACATTSHAARASLAHASGAATKLSTGANPARARDRGGCRAGEHRARRPHRRMGDAGTATITWAVPWLAAAVGDAGGFTEVREAPFRADAREVPVSTDYGAECPASRPGRTPAASAVAAAAGGRHFHPAALP
jgi:hypothetical protein